MSRFDQRETPAATTGESQKQSATKPTDTHSTGSTVTKLTAADIALMRLVNARRLIDRAIEDLAGADEDADV